MFLPPLKTTFDVLNIQLISLENQQLLLLVHLCLQFAKKYPNCNCIKKYLGQHNSYPTLPKDTNVHDISPT